MIYRNTHRHPHFVQLERYDLRDRGTRVVRYPSCGPYRERMERSRDDDACPSALQVHRAADGALARVRLPGGALSAEQLQTLAELADRLGSGTLELTSRGSVQLRGLTDSPADHALVAEAVAGAGLLPSPTHERARNIVASPLSGRLGGLADVRPLVRRLDAAILAAPALAGLPGRFWFALDDGRGDVTGLRADSGVQMLGPDSAALLLCGADTGVRLPVDDVAPALVTVAERFLAIREKRWRMTELSDAARFSLLADLPLGTPGTLPHLADPTPVGWIEQHDGLIALGAVVPLGVLPARTAEFLAAVLETSGTPMIVTPWRSVLVCDLTEAVADTALQVLPSQGLVFDADSPWLRISACVGSPGCERAGADVRADAVRAAESGASGRLHYVGCERACGSPPDSAAGAVMVATPDGYRPRIPS